VRIVLVGVAAAALLAGCGGHARRTETAPAKAGPPTRAAVLERYYAAMGGRERRFDRLGDRIVAIVDRIDPARPGAGWDDAARRLRGVSGELQALAVELSRVRPPADVARPHRVLAESTVAFSDWIAGLEQALATHQPGLLAAAVENDTSAIRNARAGWRTAVLRYSAKLGVTPPEWLVPSPPA
jgi:hypothetical protein